LVSPAIFNGILNRDNTVTTRRMADLGSVIQIFATGSFRLEADPSPRAGSDPHASYARPAQDSRIAAGQSDHPADLPLD
jgi:hypothetical protein